MCSPPSDADAGTSLGEIARQKRGNTPRRLAKVVITEDEIKIFHGPIPTIALSGPENLQEIILAINNYRVEHNPEETEAVIRDWYEQQISTMRAAQRDVKRMYSAQWSGYYDSRGYNGDGEYDPEKDAAKSRFNQIANANDQKIVNDGQRTADRIRTALLRVGSHLQSVRLRYKWFETSFYEYQ